MRRSTIILLLLLAIQTGLVVVLRHEDQSLARFEGEKSLLNLDIAKVNHLVFEGADKKTVLLDKTSGHWKLPDYFSARADEQKIEQLLKTLDALRRPWPVAESNSVAKRFKVANETYERRLKFMTGDKVLATLYLGSSPGFRKVHARLEGEETIYDIPFSTYKVSLKAKDWIDTRQLQIKPDQISSINLPDCRLERKQEKLQLTGLSSTEQMQEKKVDELVQSLATLRILDIVGRAQTASQPPKGLKLTLTLRNGKVRKYQLFDPEEPARNTSTALLQVSDLPYTFKISKTLKQQLQSFTRSQLVKNKTTPDQKNSGQQKK
jgi:hypothetical protein